MRVFRCKVLKQVGTMGLSSFFSLDFGKIITTGEGGMICTNKNQYLVLKAMEIMVISINLVFIEV